MLESIAINKRIHPHVRQPFSVGHLAECLLFYGRVDAVISPSELEELICRCGVETLVTLLSTGALSLYLTLKAFGTTVTPNTARVNYAVLSMVNTSIEIQTYKALQKVYRHAHKSKHYQAQLLPYIREYEYEYDLIGGFLLNESFSTSAFREVVKQTFPDYPIPLDLTYKMFTDEKRSLPEEMGTDHTLETETNFDIQQFERDLLKHGITGHRNFAVTFMMQVAAAIKDIDVASHFQSELSTEESSAPIIQNAILKLDQYKPSNQAVIVEFNEHVINGFPSVADAINSGRRSFSDFMLLLDRSQRFRDWLRQAPDDSDSTIISEYLRANEVDVFTDSTLHKALKFIVVSTPLALNPITLAGQPDVLNNGINLIAGTAIDLFADLAFRRFNQWKPNQFVQNDLKNFLVA